MFCAKCGKEISEETTFCPYCGTEVKKNAEVNEENDASPAAQENGTNQVKNTLNGLKENVSNLKNQIVNKFTKTESGAETNSESGAVTETGTEANEATENNKKSKFNWWEVIGSAAVFAWNSYVIFHNFAVHDGYFWAIAAIVVNLVILGGLYFMLADMKGKKAGIIALGVALAIFITGGVVGCSTAKPSKGQLERQSAPIVDQLLENFLGKGNAASCKKVTILKEISKDYYYACAELSNGNDISIFIEYYPDAGYIEVELAN